jgi:hypothetical protein
MTGRIYLCPPADLPLVIPNPECPRSDLHTPCPSGYVDWFEWMATMQHKGNRSVRCPGCDLYMIVTGGRP